jgi:hypothetical protein
MVYKILCLKKHSPSRELNAKCPIYGAFLYIRQYNHYFISCRSIDSKKYGAVAQFTAETLWAKSGAAILVSC